MKQQQQEDKGPTLAIVLFVVLILTLIPAGAQAQYRVGNFTKGSVTLGFDNRTCDAALEGAIRYNSATSCAEYCDSAAWTCPAGAGSGCGVYGTFDIADTPGADQSVVVESATQKIDTDACAASVSVSGQGNPAFRICDDAACSAVAHDWGNVSEEINDGQYLQLRLTSSATPDTTLTSTVLVGSTIDDWAVTTEQVIRVFVTSTTHDGDLDSGSGAIAGADAICDARADAAGLSGKYIAWIAANADSDPTSRFSIDGTSQRFILVDGTTVADDWTDLTDGTLDAAIDLDEDGNTVSGTDRVWTNTSQNGTFNSGSDGCLNFSNNSFAFDGVAGQVNGTTGGDWTNVSTSQTCDSALHLYCFNDNTPNQMDCDLTGGSVRPNGGTQTNSGSQAQCESLCEGLFASACGWNSGTSQCLYNFTGSTTFEAGWTGGTCSLTAYVDCPNVGDECSDGSVYAGDSPDGNVRMYATPGDAASGYQWGADGAGSTGYTDWDTGAANTAGLVTNYLAAEGGVQAAEYCAEQDEQGHDDWYLPAVNELDVLYDNRSAIGNFTTGNYWSSTETSSNHSGYQRFSDGAQFSSPERDTARPVRCVRKD